MSIMEEMRNVYKTLFDTFEGPRTLRVSRHRQEHFG